MALKQIVLLLVLISHTKSEKSRFPTPAKPNSKPSPKPNPKANSKTNPKPNPMPNPEPNPDPDPNQCGCLSKAEVMDLKKVKDTCLSKAEIIELIEDDCRDDPCKNGQCIDLVNDYRLFFVRSTYFVTN